MELIPDPDEPLSREVIEQVEIQLKYEGYIKKEEVKVERLKRMEAKKIPADLAILSVYLRQGRLAKLKD